MYNEGKTKHYLNIIRMRYIGQTKISHHIYRKPFCVRSSKKN